MQLLNQSALLKMLGWALFNSFWQMSLVWLLYVVITRLGARKFSSAIKHNLALLLLASGSVWFLVSLAANGFTHDFTQQSIIQAAIFPAGKMVFLNSWKRVIGSLLPYCSFAYLIILSFLMFRYVRYYAHSKKLKQASLCRPPAEMKVFIEGIASRIGIHKTVGLWLSSVIQTPMTIGFLKPIILIPLATINHLSQKQMEAVLLHELAHIKRQDYVLNLMVAFTEIVFFFNPFSLLLVQAIKKEREHSCDDLVLQFRYDACAYASALLSLEKTRHHNHKLAMAAVGKSNQMLLQRVMRITDQKKITHSNNPKFILIMLIAFTAAFTAVMQQKVQPRQFFAYNRLSDMKKAANPAEPLLSSHMNIKATIIRKNERVFSKTKAKLNTTVVKGDEFLGNDHYELVSNSESEDNNENISQAVEEQQIEYSMMPSPPPAMPMNISTQNYPYVPSSSFYFSETEDTVSSKRVLQQQDVANDIKTATVQSFKAFNKTNLKKPVLHININGKELYIEKLQNEIRKSLREADWDKIDGEAFDDACEEAEQKRMRQDIQLQLQALRNVKYKDLQKAQQLQQQIYRQQLKLQQATIKSQQELMKQVETIRKKIRIVYI